MSKSIKTIAQWTYFDRKRLRKINILKGDSGDEFCFMTVILDKDSLKITITRSYWTIKTFNTIVTMMLSIGETNLKTLQKIGEQSYE